MQSFKGGQTRIPNAPEELKRLRAGNVHATGASSERLRVLEAEYAKTCRDQSRIAKFVSEVDFGGDFEARLRVVSSALEAIHTALDAAGRDEAAGKPSYVKSLKDDFPKLLHALALMWRYPDKYSVLVKAIQNKDDDSFALSSRRRSRMQLL